MIGRTDLYLCMKGPGFRGDDGACNLLYFQFRHRKADRRDFRIRFLISNSIDIQWPIHEPKLTPDQIRFRALAYVKKYGVSDWYGSDLEGEIWILRPAKIRFRGRKMKIQAGEV